MTSRNSSAGGGGTSSKATIALCLAIALLEGLDLQSAGVAGPRMAKEFHLAVAQMGWAFSAGAIGLLPGAALGGRLADRFGRKRVLMWSVALFGLFSLATTMVWNFESLLVARLLTGLGLGAAMPNLIALCSEAAGEQQRSTAVGAMYCGMPFGAAIAAVIGMLGTGEPSWRHVFYVGGLGPIVMVPLLGLFLRESQQFVAAQASKAAKEGAPTVTQALWRAGRARTTIALWISYLGTLIVLYFLMNWLPSMVLARGLTRVQSNLVLMLFNIGGGIGAVAIATIMDRFGRRGTVIGMYVGIVAALTVLASAGGASSTAVGGLLCGFFIVGGQSVLYALAGHAYPTEVRGTGVGAAVAVGRLGSILGPLVAGQLFALGQSPSMLVGSSIPLVVIAALAALSVVGAFRQRRTLGAQGA
ncbi:3-(3-hydroxy-phenyl)propionate transporter MhpT [Paraburkholderia silvatlantica]|uniref:AAHS family 3-hydroxyphenylpropionic acid transporter n=1 Tax=Paraburkholderia silvatlantica TaxID=321895 RepID=A0ABR6FWC3_9BURK|nr:3-(3-hydroxy-phenyl)propionate transporter MhpT [Paraburkholderia silvatlantica]MBB2931736.1 AAHS family 3-hydroxyphenylpropionic acid transporter [Paraburkholderia silvatlantica]PVY26384.1 AAHS family 3-hydroxyphenylpropionic acid transporter [Paraburkholderia silvatlantica]PXW32135.1 AAHS family 3-hydroxyphenylpropionic acid transporter [Paraburkholderia silvatlantica]TDQ82715.1 AAHS family 3-hydroxyphenylpropionic acid transporter [Paraburkholderia silvatlantica]